MAKQLDENLALTRLVPGWQAEKVIIVGNGAVKNGWLPLEHTIHNRYETVFPSWPLLDEVLKKEALPQILSHYVFRYRLAIRRVPRIVDDQTAKLDIGPFRGVEEDIDGFLGLTQEIGEAYTAAASRGLVRLKGDIDSLRNNDFPSTMVITTNWDELLWSDTDEQGHFTFPNIVQLHGRASIPESLVLPTEFVIEDMPSTMFSLIKDSKLQHDAVRALEKRIESSVLLSKLARRSPMVHKSLTSAHGTALRWLRTAREVILWGLALHEYDSELMTILYVTADQRDHDHMEPYQLKVIDISEDVVRRACAILRVPYAPNIRQPPKDCL